MSDFEIYKKAEHVLESGEKVALITIISTVGSTPGKTGYKMLICSGTDEPMGTVGGGFAEAEMVAKARNILPKIDSKVFVIDFDDAKGEKGICGGTAEFLIETFDKRSKSLFKVLSESIENGWGGVLISYIKSEKSTKKIFIKDINQINSMSDIEFSNESIESMKRIVYKGQPAKISLKMGIEIYIEPISEQPMVFIFGAGHLSYHISKYAKSLNFRVTICDNRLEFANKERFPEADRIIVENFEDIFNKINIDQSSYCVIVTSGHKFDELVLEKAVMTNAKYIGMIGSKRKVSIIMKRLKEKGIPVESLKRIYSPIGLSIGAVIPEEIAISIISELIKIRRVGINKKIDHMAITSKHSL